MSGRRYGSEDAGLADRAAYLDALREICDVYAEALTPEQWAELGRVCPLTPCCRRTRRRRRRSRKDLSDNLAAVLKSFGEQLLEPRR